MRWVFEEGVTKLVFDTKSKRESGDKDGDGRGRAAA
jgi:hypothetical protein